MNAFLYIHVHNLIHMFRLKIPINFTFPYSVFLGTIPFRLLVDTILYMCAIIVFAYYDQLGCDPVKTGQVRSTNQVN